MVSLKQNSPGNIFHFKGFSSVRTNWLQTHNSSVEHKEAPAGGRSLRLLLSFVFVMKYIRLDRNRNSLNHEKSAVNCYCDF